MTDKCVQCGFPTGEGHVCPVQGQGMRHNASKPRVDLIPAIVLLELGKHYTYGANKYHANNWLAGFPYSETTASLLRHLYAWMAGERNDTESGHHHLVAVIWNAVALFYFELFPQRYAKFDDRPVKLPAKINFNVDVAYDPEPSQKAWEALNTGKFDAIPPTVPIPEDFFMLKTGERIDPEDFYYDATSTWKKVPNAWVGVGYDKSMGPIIHKSKAPYRSESVKIHNVVGDPCTWCGAEQGQQHRDHCKRGDYK